MTYDEIDQALALIPKDEVARALKLVSDTREDERTGDDKDFLRAFEAEHMQFEDLSPSARASLLLKYDALSKIDFVLRSERLRRDAAPKKTAPDIQPAPKKKKAARSDADDEAAAALLLDAEGDMDHYSVQEDPAPGNKPPEQEEDAADESPKKKKPKRKTRSEVLEEVHEFAKSDKKLGLGKMIAVSEGLGRTDDNDEGNKRIGKALKKRERDSGRGAVSWVTRAKWTSLISAGLMGVGALGYAGYRVYEKALDLGEEKQRQNRVFNDDVDRVSDHPDTAPIESLEERSGTIQPKEEESKEKTSPKGKGR